MEREMNPVIRVTVTIERRSDGGLYVYSDDLPGFVLSHSDAEAVLSDIEPALATFLSQTFRRQVAVKPLLGIREALIQNGFVPSPSEAISRREYAGIAA